MLHTQAALTAVIAATGASRLGRMLCAKLLDAAVLSLGTGGAEIFGAEPDLAIAEVTAVCVACRACPRGWTADIPANERVTCGR
jgi:hypothetical protein